MRASWARSRRRRALASRSLSAPRPTITVRPLRRPEQQVTHIVVIRSTTMLLLRFAVGEVSAGSRTAFCEFDIAAAQLRQAAYTGNDGCRGSWHVRHWPAVSSPFLSLPLALAAMGPPPPSKLLLYSCIGVAAPKRVDGAMADNGWHRGCRYWRRRRAHRSERHSRTPELAIRKSVRRSARMDDDKQPAGDPCTASSPRAPRSEAWRSLSVHIGCSWADGTVDLSTPAIVLCACFGLVLDEEV